MSKLSVTNRRSFIKIAGGALAFPTIISSRVLGASAPSNTLLVGMIGVIVQAQVTCEISWPTTACGL